MRILFERERPAEREVARREFDVPPSLTDTYISGDSSLVQSAFKKKRTATFVLAWPIALN